MKRSIAFFAITCLEFAIAPAFADFDGAMQNARGQCGGISGYLNRLNTMAGVGTAVTAVGTIAGGGALYAGIKKSGVDAAAKELEEQLENLHSLNDEEFLSLLSGMAEYSGGPDGSVSDQLAGLDNESKRLGNWRTGLLAGNTATNIASVVISARSKNTEELSAKISECLDSIDLLRNEYMQARLQDDKDAAQLAFAQGVIAACGQYNALLARKVSGKANGALISSAIGIGTGAAGTITSAAANADGTRNNNSGKEKNLNNASNILAGASTVASGVATGFNIATLGAINKAKGVAKDCEAALK